MKARVIVVKDDVTLSNDFPDTYHLVLAVLRFKAIIATCLVHSKKQHFLGSSS